MILTVDSFSTSSGFISSCDPGITAGHPGGLDSCLSRAYHVPPCRLPLQGSISSRRFHWPRRLSRACDTRNMGQIPISALLWQTTRGQLETHHRQAHKVKCSTAEHSPCPATAPQELKRAQHTHCPPGARNCPPIHASRKHSAKCQGPDRTHCTGPMFSWSLAHRAHIDNSSQKPP